MKFTYRTQSSVTIRVKGTKSHCQKRRPRYWLSPEVRFFISYQGTFDIFICESTWFFEILFLFTEEFLCTNWNVNVIKDDNLSICNSLLNLDHLFYNCYTIVQLYNRTTNMPTCKRRKKYYLFKFDPFWLELTAFMPIW